MFQVCVVSCFASVCQDAWHYAEEAVAFAEGAIAAGSAGRFEGICHLLWMLGLFPLLFRSPLSWHIVYFPRFRAFLGLVFFSSALGALLAPNNLGTRFYSEPGTCWCSAGSERAKVKTEEVRDKKKQNTPEKVNFKLIVLHYEVPWGSLPKV